MNDPVAHPPLQRGSMHAEPWAGSPWAQLRARWRGRLRWQAAAGDARPFIVRRFALLLLVLAGAWVGTHAMAEVLPDQGSACVEKILLLLFGVLFAWISAGFWTGVMGVWVILRGPGRSPISRGLAEAPLRPIDAAARTAIVMPICNEHVPTVFGGLQATLDSLVATGEARRFDAYVLSDSSDADSRAAEQAAWSDLAAHFAGSGGAPALRVHYRWRQRRAQRKAGNIADFCRRWGRAYRYFVVLDADSVMTGECLTTLVRVMEAHPDAGIVQTAPRAVGHHTFHARVQQFCARAYGPLFTAGMRFWQLGESHYWGHNAILRTAPFMAHCALAPVEGDGSLSGEILSHDFVEAALMRRAGWKVWVADEIEGSYEQVPPNLLAELQRDRRWCQGNLQNSRLMFEPGLHIVHRTAFVTGVLAYASSPLWLVFLLCSSLLFAQHAGTDPTYFVEPYQLFPIWPTANLKLMLTLFGLTGVLLLAPKALSLLAIVLRGRAHRYGGLVRLLASAVIEFVHSLLLAPVRMVFHTQFVVAALTGWKLDWKSPPRSDVATSWREAAGRHGLHTVLTVAWIVAIVAGSSSFPWWLSPILLGLLAAMPLSVLGSRAGIGRALRRRGLLLTPEERQQPVVLAAADAAARQVEARLVGFADVVAKEPARWRYTAALPARGGLAGDRGKALALAVEAACTYGPTALANEQRLHLLGSAPGLEQLAAAVLGRRCHSGWLPGRAPTVPMVAPPAPDPSAAGLLQT